jgi:hypothetical protein
VTDESVKKHSPEFVKMVEAGPENLVVTIRGWNDWESDILWDVLDYAYRHGQAVVFAPPPEGADPLAQEQMVQMQASAAWTMKTFPEQELIPGTYGDKSDFSKEPK